MFKFLRTLALSAIVGLGAVAAMPAAAEAAGGSIYLGFGSGHGPGAGFRFDDRGRHHYRGPGRYHGRECSPRDAVRKASRMGLRNARVVDVGRRTIKVAGRGHGYRPAMIVFGKARSCPVLR
jgi:hypothetical protein